MILSYRGNESTKRDTSTVAVFEVSENSSTALDASSKMGIESNEQTGERLIRCATTGCFEKNNICCKSCDTKKCCYKCDFIDEEVCEHQFI